MKGNNVAKHAHLAGRAGVHEKSGKHYNRTNQKVLDLEYNGKYDTNEYYTDYIDDEFIEEIEEDDD